MRGSRKGIPDRRKSSVKAPKGKEELVIQGNEKKAWSVGGMGAGVQDMVR